MTVDDLTLLRGDPVRVPLLVGEYQLLHVFLAMVHVPHVTAILRIPSKVEQVVSAQSPVHPYGSYVVPTTIDIDGLSRTSSKIGLLKDAKRKDELLHFGYVA
jgi:hypothetical protein